MWDIRRNIDLTPVAAPQYDPGYFQRPAASAANWWLVVEPTPESIVLRRPGSTSIYIYRQTFGR
jgi:hypothetical protein